MEHLIQALASEMERRGAKQAQVAAELGVTQPRLNDWLRGRRLPAGDHTLAILEWLGIDWRALVRRKK